jgi:hypothetical protein
MRRINSDQLGNEDLPRFCPNCGAANSDLGLRCTICGYLFEPADRIASYWDKVDQPGSSEHPLFFTEVIADEPEVDAPDRSAATMPYKPVTDPWSSTGGRLGADPGTTQAFVPPRQPAGRAENDGGPPGWLLGLIGIVLVGIVAAAAGLLVFQPLVAEQVESAASDAIETALAEATIAPEGATGTVVVAERDINRTIRANGDDYGPVEDLNVQIGRKGIVATFSVYGVSATLTGTVQVVENRVVIADPAISGLADRMVDVDSIAESAADAINDLLARNNLKPTAVSHANNTLTLTTVPRR